MLTGAKLETTDVKQVMTVELNQALQQFTLIVSAFCRIHVQWNPALWPPRLLDHPIITTIYYSFDPTVKITASFYYFEDPVNATTLWPNSRRIKGAPL